MDKRKANKRPRVEDLAASVDLKEGWLDNVLELPGDKLAKLIGDIANHGKIKTAAINKARTGLSSFPGAAWIDVAENCGLSDRLENNQFERVVTPVYFLLPSIHQIMFEVAWHTLDVYQERKEQRRGAARFRIMDPVCQQSHLLCF